MCVSEYVRGYVCCVCGCVYVGVCECVCVSGEGGFHSICADCNRGEGFLGKRGQDMGCVGMTVRFWTWLVA